VGFLFKAMSSPAVGVGKRNVGAIVFTKDPTELTREGKFKRTKESVKGTLTSPSWGREKKKFGEV